MTILVVIQHSGRVGLNKALRNHNHEGQNTRDDSILKGSADGLVEFTSGVVKRKISLLPFFSC